MIECVILDGKVINIGLWDDMDGENPMPEGATIEEREVAQGEDGGWYVVGESNLPSTKGRLEALELAMLAMMEFI